MADRARLTIVTGFLGAGKSTWLRHNIRSGVFSDAVVIVNEAAETPVDDRLLDGARKTCVLAGGCACCERRADLIACLHGLCDARVEGEPAPHIVLETSGLADPGAITRAIAADTHLAEALAVGEVVTCVSASHGLDVLRREPLARRQVAAADCLIVTKIDAADDVAVARLVATLDVLRPAVPLFGAVQGVEAPLPSAPASADPALLACLDEEGEDAPVTAASISLRGTDWVSLSLWLSALTHARGSAILRVKGVVTAPTGRLLLQGVGGRMDAPVVLPRAAVPDDDTLVVIGRGFTEVELQHSLHAFAAVCRAARTAPFTASGSPRS